MRVCFKGIVIPILLQIGKKGGRLQLRGNMIQEENHGDTAERVV